MARVQVTAQAHVHAMPQRIDAREERHLSGDRGRQLRGLGQVFIEGER